MTNSESAFHIVLEARLSAREQPVRYEDLARFLVDANLVYELGVMAADPLRAQLVLGPWALARQRRPLASHEGLELDEISFGSPLGIRLRALLSRPTAAAAAALLTGLQSAGHGRVGRSPEDVSTLRESLEMRAIEARTRRDEAAAQVLAEEARWLALRRSLVEGRDIGDDALMLWRVVREGRPERGNVLDYQERVLDRLSQAPFQLEQSHLFAVGSEADNTQ